mmetsp:Transcript_35228/g.83546  ORF Transcript_35228/g.83546 Transcript_35228/m.83546 type:complete len:159 (+) Transcript_35228:72-548(+)
MYHAPILYKFLGRLLLLWFRFQDRIPAKLEKESRRYKDLAFVQVYDFENNTVKDSYGHLAFKVYSYLQILVVSHTAWKWVMKLDADIYLNLDRLALDIKYYRREQYQEGAWQYAGYFNNGDIMVKTGRKKKGKSDSWIENEYGAYRSHYPPYAFGASV